MSPDSSTAANPASSGGFSVSPELEQRFPEILSLIRTSESMNDEERTYWASILPAMTPEQIQNLKQILENEKRQLAEIDAKYAAAIEETGEKKDVKVIEQEHRKRKESLQAAERSDEEKEDKAADDLLKQIESDEQKKAA